MSMVVTIFSTNAISFFPGNQQINFFRRANKNIVFIDIRNENKQSFIGEEIRLIKTT